MEYINGPGPSGRPGFSLGIDLAPLKIYFYKWKFLAEL